MNQSQYSQHDFENGLTKMLAEAKVAGKTHLRVVAKELHDRVVCGKVNRMLITCNAMWYVWREQGWHKERCFNVPRSGQSSKLQIEFVTD